MNATRVLLEELLTLPDVEEAEGDMMGERSFRVFGREFLHVHGAGLLHIGLTREQKAAAVAAGEARPHPYAVGCANPARRSRRSSSERLFRIHGRRMPRAARGEIRAANGRHKAFAQPLRSFLASGGRTAPVVSGRQHGKHRYPPPLGGVPRLR